MSLSLTPKADWLALCHVPSFFSSSLTTLLFCHFCYACSVLLGRFDSPFCPFYRTQDALSICLLRCTAAESPSGFPMETGGAFSWSCLKSRSQVLEGKELPIKKSSFRYKLIQKLPCNKYSLAFVRLNRTSLFID